MVRPNSTILVPVYWLVFHVVRVPYGAVNVSGACHRSPSHWHLQVKGPKGRRAWYALYGATPTAAIRQRLGPAHVRDSGRRTPAAPSFGGQRTVRSPTRRTSRPLGRKRRSSSCWRPPCASPQTRGESGPTTTRSARRATPARLRRPREGPPAVHDQRLPQHGAALPPAGVRRCHAAPRIDTARVDAYRERLLVEGQLSRREDPEDPRAAPRHPQAGKAQGLDCREPGCRCRASVRSPHGRVQTANAWCTCGEASRAAPSAHPSHSASGACRWATRSHESSTASVAAITTRGQTTSSSHSATTCRPPRHRAQALLRRARGGAARPAAREGRPDCLPRPAAHVRQIPGDPCSAGVPR